MQTVTIDTNPVILAELESAAYAQGNTLLASALAALIEAQECINALEERETLENWEKQHGPDSGYVEFFNDCFGMLEGHYPCPSVTSDYDKSIIFDAIQRGETIREGV